MASLAAEGASSRCGEDPGYAVLQSRSDLTASIPTFAMVMVLNSDNGDDLRSL